LKKARFTTPLFPGEEASSKGETFPDAQIKDEDEAAKDETLPDVQIKDEPPKVIINPSFTKKCKYTWRETAKLTELTELEWNKKRKQTEAGFLSQMSKLEKTALKPGELKHLVQKRMNKRYFKVLKKSKKAIKKA